jgi:hypothetical protein
MTILRLSYLIPDARVGLDDGRRWVKAVPMPPPVNRFKAAWAVLTGRAYAVAWPFAGEFEQAMVVNGYEVPR